MFREIDYSDIKRQITWKSDKLLDIKKIHPDNLQSKYMKDGGVEYFEVNSDCQNLDLAVLYDMVKDNIYLQIYLSNMFFYFNNFNVELTSNLICSASGLNEYKINMLSCLFNTTSFCEDYPIFSDNKIVRSVQVLQTTGLSQMGKDILKKLFDKDLMLDFLYNNKIISDIPRTCFYSFSRENDGGENAKVKNFTEKLFENEYLKQCGTINVSAVSFANLGNHPLCVELSKRVDNLYLLNYDMEYNGEVVFVKYLQWNSN